MRNYRKILRNRKARIDRRLRRRNWEAQSAPMMSAGTLHYEMSSRVEAIDCGGVGVFHMLAQKTGLRDEIDDRLHLLKRHLPYHESDHVMNICNNVLMGGTCLEDIELRRQDATFLDALGAEIIPDPTTAGDFTRRFVHRHYVETLMGCINTARERVWNRSDQAPFEEALIDVDGTLAPTTGECKKGMEYSYTGIWGYHPLIVSLANTGEVLFLENRPGNVASHEGAAAWIDQAIDLVSPHSKRICLRGDTGFYLTKHLDRWSEHVDFVFGMDAYPNLKDLADALSAKAWRPLKRKPKHEVKTQKRKRPANVKESIVRKRAFKNIRLVSEHVAEFSYRPTHCEKDYRVVVLRKNLSIEKGEDVLFPEIKYFFYITSRTDLTVAEVVELANGRCNQENVIEQLKNGVNAMRMPVDNLLSNWAYMVMAALAWNLKAWFAMLVPQRERGTELRKMEFRRFLNYIVRIPCQIIRHGRQLIYRVLNYNVWSTVFFATSEKIRKLKMA